MDRFWLTLVVVLCATGLVVSGHLAGDAWLALCAGVALPSPLAPRKAEHP